MLPEVTLAGFGAHTRQIGLYTVENESLYCQYLCLTRPALGARALGNVFVIIVPLSSSLA